MLLRIADHLYWMGRYIERAEDTARAVEGAYHAALLPKGYALEEWESLLEMLGQRDRFPEPCGSASTLELLRFVILDLENPSSILSSLRSARENGRATCGTISLEAWESLNALWLDLSEIDPSRLISNGTLPLLARVNEGTQLFRSVIQTKLDRDEVFQWIGLGIFLERADYLTRILHARYPFLFKSAKGDAAYYSSMALLRWAGAVDAYRKLYRNGVTPRQVIELLVLNEETQCSLHACLERINTFLCGYSNGTGGKAADVATDLHILFHETRDTDLFGQELSVHLAEVARKLHGLAGEIDRWFQGTPCV
ncbi:MAG TPA: alpha-E domain-containing protein [Nitrospiria bacterium]|nr:alpha-E domain-containing protein [Nitrospiria bacterium]HUK55638.1 alpha-E domain-containing protein [Nitrospiria bacterium]